VKKIKKGQRGSPDSARKGEISSCSPPGIEIDAAIQFLERNGWKVKVASSTSWVKVLAAYSTLRRHGRTSK
jgi:hypothetical protein